MDFTPIYLILMITSWYYQPSLIFKLSNIPLKLTNVSFSLILCSNALDLLPSNTNLHSFDSHFILHLTHLKCHKDFQKYPFSFSSLFPLFSPPGFASSSSVISCCFFCLLPLWSYHHFSSPLFIFFYLVVYIKFSTRIFTYKTAFKPHHYCSGQNVYRHSIKAAYMLLQR